jgi:hypothetical protein
MGLCAALRTVMTAAIRNIKNNNVIVKINVHIYLHDNLLERMLLLAWHDNAWTNERLLQAGDDFILEGEKSDAVIAKHIELLGNISKPSGMENIGILNIEFCRLGGKKQIEI